jgi:hypothetical protein
MPSDSGVTSRSRMSFCSPGEHAALDGGADGDHLVRVDAAVRLLAEELLDRLLDLRDARRAADEDHLVDLVGVEPRVLERHLHRRIVRCTRSSTSCSNLARLSVTLRCLGPSRRP